MNIDYYNENADEFIANTINVDMSSIHKRFLSLIPEGGYILDAGCGSGRDTKIFLEKGYQVDAYDPSPVLALKATQYTGIDVYVDNFEDFEPDQPYDGIWACASLLHEPRESLPLTFKHLLKQLKPSGVLYLSMVYGHGEHERNGRIYTDLDEAGIDALIASDEQISPVAIWISEDKRPNRNEQWLNAIVRYCPEKP